MSTSAKALQEGRALVDRAIQALGGAGALDAVSTYTESSTVIQKRAEGDATVVTKTTWRFPGDIRSDRSMSMGTRQQTNGQLITPEGGWFIGQGRVFPQNPLGRTASEQELSRQLVPLLHTHASPAFKAAALGSATVDGTQVDRVRIQNGIVDVTLGIDPKSGRAHSLSFVGRNQEAMIGEYTLVFGDYRQASGLLLPFEMRALFDGQPDAFRSAKIDAIAVNPAVDAALFQLPKGEPK